MSKTITAEFYSLYQYQKLVKQCSQVAYSIQKDAEELALPKSAFTQLGDADKLHKAWKAVCGDRKKEAKALHNELDAVAKALSAVAALYGWTDADLAGAIARAEKQR